MESLVIGYGNDLRSDDGAGRVVANRVNDLHLQGVEVRSVSQLTPELALEIGRFDTVVFVDASIDVAETTTTPVAAAPTGPSAMTHYSSPETLLGMTASMGQAPERAFAVSIPVVELGFGFELTPVTENGVEEAVAMVKDILND
ncbi:MAG: hydrogenase maturation protease [bacterium]|nr:hydrogenase maturation protease [bacterium]